MNRDNFSNYHKELTEKAFNITAAKRHDYCGKDAEDNVFSNLQLVEKMGICSTEVGILTRISDKLSRIKSFIDVGVLEVKDEKIEDTGIDLLNYTILLLAVIKDKKDKDNENSSDI